MSEFKIDGPGFYSQRNGSKAEIVGKNAFGLWAGFDYGEGESAYADCESWDSIGRFRHDMDEPCESGHDIVARWPRFAVGDRVRVVDSECRVRHATVTRDCNNSNNRYMVEDGGWAAWKDESELVTDDRPAPPEQWVPTCELRHKRICEFATGSHRVSASNDCGYKCVRLEQRWTCGDKSEWRPIPVEVT